ncbi:MAG: hypothetical protein M3Y27_10870, partial [Acidobacteriota bacterium]|nr:hypothetical protein [Acidobacteriota bacterium]
LASGTGVPGFGTFKRPVLLNGKQFMPNCRCGWVGSEDFVVSRLSISIISFSQLVDLTKS